jgi:hypothetical protein
MVRRTERKKRMRYIIYRSRLDEMVEIANEGIAEIGGDPMTADEMLGYLDDPEVVEDRDAEQN